MSSDPRAAELPGSKFISHLVCSIYITLTYFVFTDADTTNGGSTTTEDGMSTNFLHYNFHSLHTDLVFIQMFHMHHTSRRHILLLLPIFSFSFCFSVSIMVFPSITLSRLYFPCHEGITGSSESRSSMTSLVLPSLISLLLTG